MAYVPERGDAVWISMNPQAGHEQAGRRPAIVLSPQAYNRKVGLAILCPITNQIKGYPFEVVIPAGFAVTGAGLVNLVGRSVDCIKTPDHQDEILRSRVEATRVLGAAMRAIDSP